MGCRHCRVTVQRPAVHLPLLHARCVYRVRLVSPSAGAGWPRHVGLQLGDRHHQFAQLLRPRGQPRQSGAEFLHHGLLWRRILWHLCPGQAMAAGHRAHLPSPLQRQALAPQYGHRHHRSLHLCALRLERTRSSYVYKGAFRPSQATHDGSPRGRWRRALVRCRVDCL